MERKNREYIVLTVVENSILDSFVPYSLIIWHYFFMLVTLYYMYSLKNPNFSFPQPTVKNSIYWGKGYSNDE